MNAIHNITMNNGWAMAITGYIIVLCGLAILALIISQLHRIIEFFDKQHSKAPPHEMQTTSQDSTVDKKTDIDPLNDPAATARCYQPLTMGLGDAFPLNSLYELFKQENIAHPHLTIRCLRENGLLMPVGDGLFGWNVD